VVRLQIERLGAEVARIEAREQPTSGYTANARCETETFERDVG
jgi:hypothetical protein